MDRAGIVHESFLRRVAAGDFPRRRARVTLGEAGLDGADLARLFDSQILSRHLDRMARQLQARGEAFYTIGSSGHEGNAAIAAAFRPDDMAFLHYRDAAFLIERATQVPGQDPARDLLLSFAASADDPISGGRHKVLGSKALFIPPQTSTIASHLPKATGTAYAIGLSRRAPVAGAVLARDGVVLASFGDASANHSTALGAINAALWAAHQGVPMPVVFICEDNGIGISTPTPSGWIAASFGQRPGLTYIACDGGDLPDTYRAAREAERVARRTRRPVFLHMRCVRLYGHAGADVQTAYRSRAAVEAEEADDPLLHGARALVENGVMKAGAVLDRYRETGERVERLAEEVIRRPRLRSAAEVMRAIVPPARPAPAPNRPAPETRAAVFGEAEMRTMDEPQPMGKLINRTLTDLMLAHPEIVLAGEDIGPKGGVYGVTQKLHDRFGPNRVINTLLDEQSILGLAIGLAHNGYLPVPEIQFLAYLHNAEDQIRGEAATLPFFSDGQYDNPMVLRIAGLGYQRGFGGHFHNDNAIAVLRDIPGLILACPSDGAEAALLLREAVRLAREERRLVVFLEPIALYATRDLHEAGDGLWRRVLPAPGDRAAFGSVRVEGEPGALTIVTYGNGAYLSAQARAVLAAEHGIAARIIDLRWLAPLPEAALLDALGDGAPVLIVDECRRSGGPAEALMALMAENGHRVARLTAEDSFIATGPAYAATLPSREGIVAAAQALVAWSHPRPASA